MDHKKVYQQLISRAILENRQKHNGIYYESHHIVPKCLNGDSKKSNLVLLTAREHFLSHWLLAKIYPDNYKIIYAFNSFCLNSKNLRPVSKHYKYAKELHIQAVKNNLEVRKKNSNALKQLLWMIDPSGKNIRVHKDLVPKFLKSGCRLGRIIKYRRPTSEETKLKIGKSNSGKPVSSVTREKIRNAHKNKSYEERYGKERAEELKKLRREAMIKFNNSKNKKL
jgi:hypothetical protein